MLDNAIMTAFYPGMEIIHWMSFLSGRHSSLQYFIICTPIYVKQLIAYHWHCHLSCPSHCLCHCSVCFSTVHVISSVYHMRVRVRVNLYFVCTWPHELLWKKRIPFCNSQVAFTWQEMTSHDLTWPQVTRKWRDLTGSHLEVTIDVQKLVFCVRLSSRGL